MNQFRRLFRPAKSTSSRWNLTKTFLQTSVFLFVFLLALPKLILYLEVQFSLPSFTPLLYLGLGLFIPCSLLGLYSGYTMSIIGQGTPLPLDCPNKLVIKGPYRYVRNPMAVAGIGQGVGVGLMAGSYIVIVYALSGAVLWHYLVRPVEEEDLAIRFGEAYRVYCERVKCWLPKI